MHKTTLQAHFSCSIQRTAPKHKQYSRNETILKIGKNGHYAKALAFVNWSVCERLFKLFSLGQLVCW